MFKRFRNKISTAVVIASAATIAIPNISFAYSTQFSDVKEDKSHYEAIMELTEAGIINGYGDGTFGYSDNLQRKHSAVLFKEALDLPIPEDPASIIEEYYTDVGVDDLYAKQIAAVTPDIFKGSGGLFLPNEHLTRQQMATTIVKAMKLEDDGTDPGINLGNVDESHKQNVKILAQHGITNQLDDFRPNDPITRAQFATFLYLSMIETGLMERPEPEEEEEETEEACEAPVNAASTGTDAEEEECEVPEEEEEEDSTSEPKDAQYITTDYSTSFSDVVNIQANRTPKMDGAGRFTASAKAVNYYANPENFSDKNSPEFFQFLKLSNTPGLTADELDAKILKGKGNLSGTGAAFLEAAETYNVNVLYLIAHALHETGHGASPLAQGVEVGIDSKGKHQLVTSSNRKDLTKIETTYNMFGIGAVDDLALEAGAVRAYKEGWFTPAKAIVGGARFISNGYISEGQDTLYKMRWNPDKPGDHQYATHVMWAVIQARDIYKMYHDNGLFEHYALTFEIPKYRNQPGKTPMPQGDEGYTVDKSLAGAKGKATHNVNIRIAPGTTNSAIRVLPAGTSMVVIGENGGWFKVETDRETGWVSGDYIDFENVLQVKPDSDGLRIRTEPNTSAQIIGRLFSHDYVIGVTDDKGEFVKQGAWYKIKFGDQEGWVHGDYMIEK